MAGPLSFQGIQGGEARERCDGCVHFHPIGELVPIGDGSIRVCRACYVDATAMVLTSRIPAKVNGDSEENANGVPCRRQTGID